MPILPLKGWWAGFEAAGNKSFCINEEDLMYCTRITFTVTLCVNSSVCVTLYSGKTTPN